MSHFGRRSRYMGRGGNEKPEIETDVPSNRNYCLGLLPRGDEGDEGIAKADAPTRGATAPTARKHCPAVAKLRGRARITPHLAG